MKIGFVAMSGIRAVDQELLTLGLTLPGFVERSKTIASLPSLGLLTLAGMTPKKHQCTFLDITCAKDLPNPLPKFDLVAISSLSAQIPEAYKVAGEFQETGAQVVLGGLHASVLPEEALQHADAVAVGEGELVWPTILEDASNNKLGGVYRALGEFDLAHAPLPAFELLDFKRYNRITVQTHRGCPWSCEFCASSILLTKKYKSKPIAKVLAELDKIREYWRRPFIEFADDNSFCNRQYWKQFLPELGKRRIRWFTETDLSIYQDQELLSLMGGNGCAQVLVGFESPDSHGLDGLETKSNWKLGQWQHYGKAIKRIQSFGIRVNACFILGLDGQSAEVFDQIYDFVCETKPFEVQITVQTPFPGTPLYARLEKEGRLLYPEDWQRCTLFDVTFQPKNMSAERLRQGLLDLTQKLYTEEETQWRRTQFKAPYKKSWRQEARTG